MWRIPGVTHAPHTSTFAIFPYTLVLRLTPIRLMRPLFIESKCFSNLVHVAEKVGLYPLVKADVRSCEYLWTSANPDCRVLDEAQGASQEHNGPTLCDSRNLVTDQEFEESADTQPEFRLRLQGVHATS